MGKGIWPALAVAMVLALAPAASAATVRHASPSGANTGTCTDAEPPCSLQRAIETVAVSGDEVVLAQGDYAVSAGIVINRKLDIHGTPGQRAHVVRTTAGTLFRFLDTSAGSRLADVQLETQGIAVSTAPVTSISVLERLSVVAGSTGGRATEVAGGWILRDSVVSTPAANAKAIAAGDGVVRLVNVSASATGAGSSGVYSTPTLSGLCSSSSGVDLFATNVFVRGAGNDIEAPHQCASAESVAIAHSNFRTAKVSQTAPAHVVDMGGNQEADPLFAAPASIDFHELDGSPTIDAGVATPVLGSADIDGQARTQGAAPDIGADEYVPPAVEPVPDMHRPVASLLRVSPRRFRAAPARATRRRGGARISYALDEAAKVTFTVKRIITRVVHGKKRTGYRPLRGSFRDAGEVGGNTLRFSGRLRGRKLRPGLYRLIALPVDAAGNTGNAVYVRFRIVR